MSQTREQLVQENINYLMFKGILEAEGTGESRRYGTTQEFQKRLTNYLEAQVEVRGKRIAPEKIQEGVVKVLVDMAPLTELKDFRSYTSITQKVVENELRTTYPDFEFGNGTLRQRIFG